MNKTNSKEQEQLSLPDFEPAFTLEPSSPDPLPDRPTAASSRRKKRTTARTADSSAEASQPTVVSDDTRAKKTGSPRSPSRRKPRPPPTAKESEQAIPAVEAPRLPASPHSASHHGPHLPLLSYNRHEDCIRLEILPEPILEDRGNSALSAGYTADGRLAEIRLFNLAQHPALIQYRQAPPATPPVIDLESQQILAGIREELQFLRVGLGLTLAGVIWLLVR